MISNEELSELKAFAGRVVPLDDEIRFKIKIVPEIETTCNRGAEYCIEFYSEEKGNYLRNLCRLTRFGTIIKLILVFFCFC